MSNLKSYTLVTAPASEPVSLPDVKTYLRIDGTADDAVLTTLIASARRTAEEYTKRAFITQSWKLVMDSICDDIDLPSGYYVLPTPFLVNGSQFIQLSRQPIQTVTSIKTTDTSNVQSTVNTVVYTLDTATGRILLNDGYSWPTNLRCRSAVEVQFVAGWANAAAVPDPVKQGILQHVAASYTNKVCSDIPAGAKSLYDAFRLPEAFGAY
ncbi:head-tail connector protein [Rhizobium leguminosarum]|uniref:head-tail connector protein n=1 Tax=Rhizobium leguminosarum TaxID=384 RepID=UPI00161F9CB6|nr:head-tail connector protein [Rhizobium leguminosarum]MBB4345141.1 hypothetical protein [Rhizobium leguminosarum]MBB6298212.1 hypothetical protein [Rhizobium leguminosarum]